MSEVPVVGSGDDVHLRILSVIHLQVVCHWATYGIGLWSIAPEDPVCDDGENGVVIRGVRPSNIVPGPVPRRVLDGV